MNETLEAKPLVTFVVPCYNSAAYMSRCIDSLLTAGDECQIIIINDGSSDKTLDIAQAYAIENPRLVEVIDQPNSGWGGGINNGLAAARGRYFKVVDSDDWLNPDELSRVMDTLRESAKTDTPVDLLVTNFVYDHVSDNTTHVISYAKLMPSDRNFGWQDVGRYKIDQYIMIHATWYRTQILRDSGIVLPTNVCYMDSYLVLHPLRLVKNLRYLNADVYHYLIGREDQSINIDVLKKRIDQQLLATKIAIDDYVEHSNEFSEPKMTQCMVRYMCAMMSVSTIYLFMINTPESVKKEREIWNYMKQQDPDLAHKVFLSIAGLAHRRTALGRWAVKRVYTLVKKIVKFA